MADVPDNGLPSRVDVDMLNSHRLFAAAPEFGEGFSLRRVGSQQLHCEVSSGFYAVHGAALLSAREHRHGRFMSGRHLDR
jgi:hypothetical protein